MIQRTLCLRLGVFTAQNTGIYNLALTVRSGSQVGDTNMYRKKTGKCDKAKCLWCDYHIEILPV